MSPDLLNKQQFQAIQSGQLADARAFVEAHPERLNSVRYGIKWGGRGRGEGEELTIMGMLLDCK